MKRSVHEQHRSMQISKKKYKKKQSNEYKSTWNWIERVDNKTRQVLITQEKQWNLLFYVEILVFCQILQFEG